MRANQKRRVADPLHNLIECDTKEPHYSLVNRLSLCRLQLKFNFNIENMHVVSVRHLAGARIGFFHSKNETKVEREKEKVYHFQFSLSVQVQFSQIDSTIFFRGNWRVMRKEKRKRKRKKGKQSKWKKEYHSSSQTIVDRNELKSKKSNESSAVFFPFILISFYSTTLELRQGKPKKKIETS